MQSSAGVGDVSRIKQYVSNTLALARGRQCAACAPHIKGQPSSATLDVALQGVTFSLKTLSRWHCVGHRPCQRQVIAEGFEFAIENLRPPPTVCESGQAITWP
jgi:hypothetical protein